MSTPLLEIRNLETFYGPIMALRGVSLSVGRGRVVTVLGANGAGKTTLLKTISGIMTAEKGEILLEGERVSGLEPHRVVEAGIVHVPEGREVFPLLTVDENLTLGAYRRRDKAEIARDREMVFNYFPILAERRAQEAGTLSGGQQQMLAIGRALMSDPRYVLLDEPTLGLAPLMVDKIRDVVVEINQSGVGVLLVEQNATMALSIAHHGYVMETGRVVLDKPAEQLLRDDDVREFYLGLHPGEDGHKSFRDVKHYKRRKRWSA